MNKKALFAICSGMLYACSGTADAEHSIRAAIHVGIEPFAYYNEGNELIGINIDLAELIAQSEDLNLEIIEVEDEAPINLILNGTADIVFYALPPSEESEVITEASTEEETDKIYTEIYVTLEEEEFAIAVRNDDEEFLDQLNQCIASLKETGELDLIIQKYITEELEVLV